MRPDSGLSQEDRIVDRKVCTYIQTPKPEEAKPKYPRKFRIHKLYNGKVAKTSSNLKERKTRAPAWLGEQKGEIYRICLFSLMTSITSLRQKSGESP